MKKAEYHEGPEALENFKKLAEKIIQTPVEKQEKEPRKSKKTNVREKQTE
jgi:hypothetical protein